MTMRCQEHNRWVRCTTVSLSALLTLLTLSFSSIIAPQLILANDEPDVAEIAS